MLAHGGSARWDQLVREAVSQADLSVPVEVAFGMGMHQEEVNRFQQAVDRLEQQHIDQLIVVPLLISSVSEVMRQFEYLMGLRDHGPWEKDVRPVLRHVPVMITAALDDDPVVSEVLLDRIRDLSRSPADETVVLVAHGPVSDEDNAHWLEHMQSIARRLRIAGRFQSVVPVTMRDDAPELVQQTATRQMREIVERASRQGPVLVVPLLLASGGIEEKIPQRLKGLKYEYQGLTLLPHPKLSKWIAERVQAVSTALPLMSDDVKLVPAGSSGESVVIQ